MLLAHHLCVCLCFNAFFCFSVCLFLCQLWIGKKNKFSYFFFHQKSGIFLLCLRAYVSSSYLRSLCRHYSITIVHYFRNHQFEIWMIKLQTMSLTTVSCNQIKVKITFTNSSVEKTYLIGGSTKLFCSGVLGIVKSSKKVKPRVVVLHFFEPSLAWGRLGFLSFTGSVLVTFFFDFHFSLKSQAQLLLCLPIA